MPDYSNNTRTISRQRLAGVLAMMSSSHDGECLSAARAAERMRHQSDLSWHEVLGMPPDVYSANETPQREWLLDSWPLKWRWAACACLELGVVLLPGDRKFLVSVISWRRLSEAQLATLLKIVSKLLVRTA